MYKLGKIFYIIKKRNMEIIKIKINEIIINKWGIHYNYTWADNKIHFNSLWNNEYIREERKINKIHN